MLVAFLLLPLLDLLLCRLLALWRRLFLPRALFDLLLGLRLRLLLAALHAGTGPHPRTGTRAGTHAAGAARRHVGQRYAALGRTLPHELVVLQAEGFTLLLGSEIPHLVAVSGALLLGHQLIAVYLGLCAIAIKILTGFAQAILLLDALAPLRGGALPAALLCVSEARGGKDKTSGDDEERLPGHATPLRVDVPRIIRPSGGTSLIRINPEGRFPYRPSDLHAEYTAAETTDQAGTAAAYHDRQPVASRIGACMRRHLFCSSTNAARRSDAASRIDAYCLSDREDATAMTFIHRPVGPGR